MSNKNRNKGNQQMSNQNDQTKDTPTPEELDTKVQDTVLDGGDATTGSEDLPVAAEGEEGTEGVTAESTETPKEEKTGEEPQNTVIEPPVPTEVVVPPVVEQKQIKVGAVVDPNQGKLGKEASKETITRVTNASTAKQEVTTSSFEQKIEAIMANGTTREKYVVTSLQSYIDSVRVGMAVDVDAGVRAQQSLHRVLLNIVSSDEDFAKAFKLVIAFVRENRTGVFADTHAFRFFEFVKPGQQWPTTLRNLLTLLIVAAGVTNKKEVHKIVKVSKAVDGLGDSVSQRIVQYFA